MKVRAPWVNLIREHASLHGGRRSVPLLGYTPPWTGKKIHVDADGDGWQVVRIYSSTHKRAVLRERFVPAAEPLDRLVQSMKGFDSCMRRRLRQGGVLALLNDDARAFLQAGPRSFARDSFEEVSHGVAEAAD
eukprot:7378303-Pyramimonas_sp.AAC.1